ncbi:MAG: thioredoxin domain-containing protein [Patescibacteria group bacterium]|nr:thioredoxin domain-containing protein [Patescibacteria group bacterium]
MSDQKKFELSPSISIVAAGVLIAGAIVFVNRYPAAQSAAAAAGGTGATATAEVPAPSSSDHIQGSPQAPIVLVEYSDFQCPYCQLIYPELKDIVQKSNGQVAWVMREFPLYQIHPNALPAAEAAECLAAQLGNSAWWSFAGDDFNNQSEIGTSFFSAEAQKLGANMTQYNACVASSTYQTKIEGQIAEAENNGGNGTPYTVVINTKTGKQYPVSGAVPEAQLQSVINQALASQ